MLLANKSVLITGGAGPNGLGFATARQMASHGARVAIMDLEGAEPAKAAAQLGTEHLGVVASVTDKAAVDRAVNQVLDKFGRIDILVNNAGITQPRKTLDISAADYDAVLDVSLRGTLLVSQAVIPAMERQAAAPSSAFPPSPRSAAAASWAGRTTRPRKPACWAWRAPWPASSAASGSGSTASPPD
jgi:NAD(P)-dependent dehydrogenase (short-subunit alcohol dehydrogenase family)